MKDYEALLRSIQEDYTKYLPKKSLKILQEFLDDWIRKRRAEIWEKETGLDFSEHFDRKIYDNLPKPEGFAESTHYYRIEFIKFLYFVNSHYNCLIAMDNERKNPGSSESAATLITRMTNSDEEAFDKFIELYLGFREQKDILGDKFMHQFGYEW